jgi:hypothetical protein
MQSRHGFWGIFISFGSEAKHDKDRSLIAWGLHLALLHLAVSLIVFALALRTYHWRRHMKLEIGI